MKKLAIMVLILLPSTTFAAPLTQPQSESLINVVQASPNAPASAFTRLITAFSDITNTQADNLIRVIQSSPGAAASTFVGLLTAFTQDTQTKSAGSSSQTASVTDATSNTCNGNVYPSCQNGLTFVCTPSGPSCVTANGQPPQVTNQQTTPSPTIISPAPQPAFTNQEVETRMAALALDNRLATDAKSLEQYLNSSLAQMRDKLNTLSAAQSQVTAAQSNLPNSFMGTASDYQGKLNQLQSEQLAYTAEINATSAAMKIFYSGVSLMENWISYAHEDEQRLNNEPLSYFDSYTANPNVSSALNQYASLPNQYQSDYSTWQSDMSASSYTLDAQNYAPLQCNIQMPSSAGAGGIITCSGPSVPMAQCSYSGTFPGGQPDISCPSPITCTSTGSNYLGEPTGLTCME